MSIVKIIETAEERFSNQPAKLYANISKDLLLNYESLDLLIKKNDILKLLAEVLSADETKKSVWSSLFLNDKSSENTRSELQKYANEQKKVLSCPEIDEHSLLLACLKALDNKTGSNFYRPVLKEMLQTSLHKIDKFDLTEEFVGRERELSEATRILHREERNNLLIIGDVGIGKTALAQHLKYKLAGKFKLLQIYSGGDNFFDQIVNMISSQQDEKIVFFLDEMFTFNAGQIKYLIDSSQVIGTANEGSYRKFSADHPHITSKFEVLRLNETDEQTSKRIFSQNISRVSISKGVRFSKDFEGKVYSLSKKYLQEGNFPAKGITLIQEAASQAETQEDKVVDEDLVRVIISQKTNIPIESLTDVDKQDLSTLADRIKARVKGQDEAVDKVTQTIQRSRLGFKKNNKPIGSFMFVGPSGVGKTELAKTVAKEIFGDEESMIRLDMSEFSEAHMVQRLTGSPPGYIGYEEGGQLTNPVKDKPYTLVLLDEIEKAHPKVFDIFLQVLDDGRLTDGRGQKVDFTNTIIIATSNAGIEDILDLIEEGKSNDEINKEIKEILQDFFRIEFINRFDDVVIFEALKPKALIGIAKNQIQKLQFELNERNIKINASEEFIQKLANDAYDPRYGARGLLRLIQERIENVLAEGIINGSIIEGEVVEFREDTYYQQDAEEI